MIQVKTRGRYSLFLTVMALAVAALSSAAQAGNVNNDINLDAASVAQNQGGVKFALAQGTPLITHSEAELARMEKYLAERLDRSTIRKTLSTARRRKVDCVDINAQPALKNPALLGHKVQLAPLSAPAANAQLAQSANAGLLPEPLYEIQVGVAGGATALGAIATCPAATVPILEVTREDLMRFSTLDDFFSKSPNNLSRPAPNVIPPYHNGPTSLHQYAHAYRFVTNWGAQSSINVWRPYTELNSEFSLGQIWVVGGSGAGLQTLEVGSQKYHNLYGDDNAHMFIYSTRGNYAPGTGCYNNTCHDFVQVSGTYFPAMVLSPTSVYNGAQYETTVQWFKDMDGGSWWLQMQGQWVGYYPRALYNSAGVQNHAAEIDYGGEIIDGRNLNLHTSTDMGSGSFPAAWYQKAAYMRILRYNYATTTNPNTVWYTDTTSLTASRSDSMCYDIAVYYGDPNWHSYFFYGGPGYDYNNCR